MFILRFVVSLETIGGYWPLAIFNITSVKMSLMSSFQSMSWGQDSSFSAVFKAKNAAVSGKFRLESGAEVAAFGNFTEKKNVLKN